MWKIKQYENRRLAAYARMRIATMPVSDIYKPLLVDIILRRAYEYELSDQEACSDIETLIRYVKKIEIFPLKAGTLGVHEPATNTIKLSSEAFKKNPINAEEIYETLTHEVYHALARKNNRC